MLVGVWPQPHEEPDGCAINHHWLSCSKAASKQHSSGQTIVWEHVFDRNQGVDMLCDHREVDKTNRSLESDAVELSVNSLAR